MGILRGRLEMSLQLIAVRGKRFLFLEGCACAIAHSCDETARMGHPFSVDSECVGQSPQSLNSICTRIVVTDLGYLPPLVESVSIPHFQGPGTYTFSGGFMKLLSAAAVSLFAGASALAIVLNGLHQ